MKARGNLISLAYDRDGHSLLTVSVPGDWGEAFDELKAAPVAVEIKKWHPKRSLDANAYAWVLIDKLAERLRIPKVTIYREAIRSIGGVSDTVCALDRTVDRLVESWERNGTGWFAERLPSKTPGCTNLRLYYGSSSYDSKQMSALIDSLVEECETQGIETLTPSELDAIKKRGGA